MNKSTLRRSAALTAVTVLLMLGGCAVSPHYAMSPEAAAQLKSVDVNVGIEQREINPTITVSTMGGANFGLIGALIDAGVNNSRAGEAEEFIQPLRDALLDYDFDAAVLAEYGATIREVPVLAGANPVLLTGPLTESYEAALKSSEADAVLFLTTDYITSADFSEITVGLQASIFPVRAELDAFRDSGRAPGPKANPLLLSDAMYRNVFTIKAKLPEKGVGPIDNVNAWAANNGALARSAMNEAIRRAAMMLALDIEQVQGDTAVAKGQPTHKLNNVPVRVAYEEGGTTFYRFNSGAMTSEVVLAP